ncbi:MAG: hypothetical protein WCO53_14790 [Deltaproteobacteria bacterium]
MRTYEPAAPTPVDSMAESEQMASATEVANPMLSKLLKSLDNPRGRESLPHQPVNPMVPIAGAKLRFSFKKVRFKT